MTKKQQASKSSTAVMERQEIKEPELYKVILLNDDYTSMEFVVHILETIFNKTSLEAQKVMLIVHQKGSAIAGIYTKEIAETKIVIVRHLAKQNEFPLKCQLESI